MQRPCDVCGEVYEAKRATSKYCGGKCRTRATRGAVTIPRPPVTAETDAPPVAVLVPDQVDGPVTASVLAELSAVERDNTALGQAAVALARKIDSGRDTGAGLAAAVKQLGSTLAAATAGVDAEKTALDRAKDEVAARRAARGA